ncbi:AEC family transporter [Nocardia sp. NPDC050697]|uniref:AEC family transporter n=1 Tax=Nocardia sp. NPDC050697 TaxID=3155158 RepID=UPI0033EF6EE1
MNAVLAAAASVVPIVAVFAGGVIFARRKIIAAADSAVLSEFVFRLAVPAYLFAQLYAADLAVLFEPHSLSVYAATALFAAAVVAAWARFAHRADVRGIALRIMAAVQVNSAYFAIPVLVLFFGDATPILPVLLFQVLVFTMLVVAVMEATTARGGPAPAWRRAAAGAGRSLLTPVVVACLAAVALNAAAAPVPAVLLRSCEFAGAAAAPVALFALGLYLGGVGLRWRGAAPGENTLVAVKCVLFPLLMWAAMNLAGVPEPWRGSLVLIAAMPAPQNLFTIAQAYDTDVELAAAAVVKSTILALCLLPMWRLLL